MIIRSNAVELSAVFLAIGAGWASAAVVLNENFDSMGASGTAPPAGWIVGHLNPVLNRNAGGGNGSALVSETLIVTNGTANGAANGESYNYGTTGSGERAIGNIPRTTNGDHIMQVAITNNTGVPLTSFTLTYTGEQWRSQSAAASKPEKLRVFYSAATSTTGFVQLPSATFDFNAPQDLAGGAEIALDGNAAANRQVISGNYIPSAAIAPGSTFYLRWYDWNDDQTLDHGLAIDDVNVDAVPEPAAMGLLALGGLVLRRRR